MTPDHLQKLAAALAGMESVLARARGGQADDEALLEFRRYCWAAVLVADGGGPQEHLDCLVRCAKELYSDCEPDRVEVLRASIASALGALRDRLHNGARGYGKRWRDLRAA